VPETWLKMKYDRSCVTVDMWDFDKPVDSRRYRVATQRRADRVYTLFQLPPSVRGYATSAVCPSVCHSFVCSVCHAMCMQEWSADFTET